MSSSLELSLNSARQIQPVLHSFCPDDHLTKSGGVILNICEFDPGNTDLFASVWKISDLKPTECNPLKHFETSSINIRNNQILTNFLLSILLSKW